MIHNSRILGFTILEILIAMALFLIIGGGVYFAYSNILEVITKGRLNAEAAFVIEKEVETIRNLSYQDVGIQGGSPNGILVANKTITSGNLDFNLLTTVRNIDDPFDGLASTSSDTSPADYKLVELEISCINCNFPFRPVQSTTTVAPRGLETSSLNGSLFINALDASGQPVSNAAVSVINNSVSPPLNISDTTDANGQLKLVEIATSSNAYEISVSKSGYSSDHTHLVGEPSNPNPLKPHATVANQTITEISFVIDQVSIINVRTQDYLCEDVPSVDFLQEGAKLIGTSPTVLKYSANLSTDANGNYNNTSLEWDTYTFINQDTSYDVSHTSSIGPLIIDPNTTANLTWTMKNTRLSALLVIVEDDNGQPIGDAKITLTKSGFSQSLLGGQSSVAYSDWSSSQYDSKSSQIDTDTVPGQVTLLDLGSATYASNSQEWLISSTIDFGTSITTFQKISWEPTGQSAQTGLDSLKFQIATNNDALTWNFQGPDGTTNTFYTSSSMGLHSSHNNDRYLRYQAYLQTIDDAFTPVLENINFEFSSSCFANNQAFFNDLANDTYTLTIEKFGYQTFVDTGVVVSSDWQYYEATLIP